MRHRRGCLQLSLQVLLLGGSCPTKDALKKRSASNGPQVHENARESSGSEAKGLLQLSPLRFPTLQLQILGLARPFLWEKSGDRLHFHTVQLRLLL